MAYKSTKNCNEFDDQNFFKLLQICVPQTNQWNKEITFRECVFSSYSSE